MDKLTPTRAKQDLRKARPSIRQASPLRFYIMLGFIGFNLVLTYVMFNLRDPRQLVIYSDTLPPEVYGVAFASTAAVMSFGLLINSWRLQRASMLFGLFLKSLFGYALVALGLKYGFRDVMGVLDLWIFIMWIQFFMYVFFVPEHLRVKREA